MSNKSVRIRTTPNGEDKYLKLNINQEFDFIEVLSLKITQEQAYRNFCSDYGVVVGRVIINSGFGVENAKVSVFIPIDDVDINNPHLKGLYPYEVVTDTDIDGKRYNVLPKYSVTDNTCFTPVGSFPNKREVLDDADMMQIYSKYYKFTTTTNHAGDFMIFGVPVGNHVIHVDADISDIGIASQRPYDSISQGIPQQMFDSPTKFKGGTNLNKLIQVKTSNTSVNVQPFWGDVNNCEVGITRVDFDLNYNIRPSAIFMGGIFGDQDSNSVNKNCRPRLKLGKICEQITGEGTIEMIRKTVDGNIEKFDIDGGRLISDDGSWAYQIPMNLDYMITDEFGDLVPSEDPNKGLPTRASVRFKIGLDETGGNGRLRTRAKYLVPNNPNNVNEIDYEFGTLTKDSSFRDLYWNKIYSVSNFINRFQRPATVSSDAKNRNMSALKDVDDCAGDKNPVPFNRVNVVFNPLFFIICLIMKIIEIIMATLNLIIIPIINLLISVWNGLINGLCSIYFGWPFHWRPFDFLCSWTIPYIPCLYALCPSDDGYVFAPWCNDGTSRDATVGAAFSDIKSTELFDLSNCVAAEMARALNLFQFDFYNDWLNGSLYSYLVKYKKRGNHYKFCDQDCSGGRCRTILLLDTCFSDASSNQHAITNEGVIKRYNGELYYAASTKDANYKLYATEVVNLGSVFSCDWQGVPKIQPALRATSYMIPPLIDEFDPQNLDKLDVSGQVDIGSGFQGMFFDISCAGLSVDERQCLNIRHSNEFGVELDQLEEDIYGIPVTLPNHNIGSDELNGENSHFVRDVLFALNNVPNSIVFNPPSGGYSTNFNINNVDVYNFASASDNGSDYIKFRGITNNDNNSFRQPTHSYYHYFGLLPGKTGLEKMNQKFFTQCFQPIENEFLIKINSTTGTTLSNSNGGAITFTVIAGNGPFTYIVSGPNGYTNTSSLSITNPTATITGLAQGSYTITVEDANGSPITQTFEINPPTPLYASATVLNDSNGTSSNGAIQITSVGGGSGSYTFTLYDHNGSIVQNTTVNGNSASFPSALTSAPLIIGQLSPDTLSDGATPTSHLGYHLRVTDTLGAFVDIWDLKVNGTQPLTVTTNVTHITCYHSNTGGSISVNINGGQAPYAITGTRVPAVNNNGTFINSGTNLVEGFYDISAHDGSQPALSTNLTGVYIGYLNPEMRISIDKVQLANQCDQNNYHIKFRIANAGAATVGPNNGKTYLDLVNTTYGNKVYYQFATDNGVGATDPATPGYWSSPIPITVPANITDTTDIEILIPSTTVFSNIGIRICTAQGSCTSDFNSDNTDLLITEMQLAPTLEVNLGPTTLYPNSPIVNNRQQCTPNSLTFKFNISHLMLGINYRAPYILHYRTRPKVNSTAVGQWSSWVTYSTAITSSQQPITIATNTLASFVFNNITYTGNFFDIEVYLVDSVGCQSNTLSINDIQIPFQVMGGGWQSSPVNGSPNQCIKRLIIPNSGGIAPYTTISGYQVYDGTTATEYQVPCNLVMLSTVTDSVGCIHIYNQ